MSAEPLHCIVFDIDDTLYLEREYVRSGFRVVGGWASERFGIQDFAEQAQVLFEEGIRGKVFDSVLTSCGIDWDDRLISEMVAVYRNHVPDIKLLPDSEASLERLTCLVRLAAITDGPLESQRKKVAALGLEDRLDPIIYTAAFGEDAWKPSRNAFRVVEDAVGCHGGACAYVGDNPAKDFDGPRSLGWITVRVRRAGGLHQAVSSGRVALEVSTLAEMEQALHAMDVLPCLGPRTLT